MEKTFRFIMQKIVSIFKAYLEPYYQKVKLELFKIASNYNLGQNIWRLFDVLPNFSFTTSETNRDY